MRPVERVYLAAMSIIRRIAFWWTLVVVTAYLAGRPATWGATWH